jgi:hypothetical protein
MDGDADGAADVLRYPDTEPSDLCVGRQYEMIRALSSAWTEYLASDQAVAGSNPAAPILLGDDQHLADGGTLLIKEPLRGRVDFITLRNGVAGIMRFAYI